MVPTRYLALAIMAGAAACGAPGAGSDAATDASFERGADVSRGETPTDEGTTGVDEGAPDESALDDAALEDRVPSLDAVADSLTDARDAAVAMDARLDAPDSARDAGFDATVPMDARPPVPATLLFNLRSAPFPGTGHPDVAVHIPPGFRFDDRPGLIVFFHGHSNCVANVVGSTDSACPPNTAVRSASRLNAQLDAARVNAILVAVQLRYDTASGDPGALTRTDSLRTLLHELCTEHLASVLGGPVDVASFERVVIGSFSGGYIAAAHVIDHGGVPQITEVDLYDSLYGETARYRGWFDRNLLRFSNARADTTRFVDLYTSGGGTAANSRTFATALRTALSSNGLSSSMYWSDRSGPLAAGAEENPVVFQFSSESHNGVPRAFFGRLAAASGFAPIGAP